MQYDKSKWIELIVQNQWEKLFELIHSTDLPKDFRINIQNLEGQYYDLKKKINNGTISDNVARAQENSLRESLLHLIDTLNISIESSQKNKRSTGLPWVAGALTIVVIIFMLWQNTKEINTKIEQKTNSISIEGVIQNQKNQSIYQAAIFLESGISFSAKTDSNGFFQLILPSINLNELQLEIAHPNYNPKKILIDSIGKEQININLGEITLVRKEVPGSTGTPGGNVRKDITPIDSDNEKGTTLNFHDEVKVENLINAENVEINNFSHDTIK